MMQIRILPVALCFLLSFVCTRKHEGREIGMDPQQQQTYDAKLVNALGGALKKARELGYENEKMKVTLSVSDSVCKVYFETIPEPGHAILGGDLTIDVDFNTHRIIDFERGQ
jgi:hypothetical protein